MRIIALVGAALAVAACGGAGEQPAGPVRDPVRVVMLPFLGSVTMTVALEEGYFEEQNLEIEPVKLARNLEAVPALARGEVDVGIGQLTANIVNAIAGGERLRLVAGSGFLDPDGCTYNAIMVRRQLVEQGRLDRPEQLRDLTVELDRLLPMAFFVDTLLEPSGLTIDDLDLVSLPVRANADALINGSIDATVVSEPLLSRIVASGEGVIWKPSEDIVPGYQLSSLMFGPNLLDERPEVGVRFLTAFLKAVRRFNEGRTPRNVELVAAHTGLEPALVEQLCWPSFDATGRLRPEGLMQFQSWLVSRGLIDEALPQDELIDSRFIERAAAAVTE